MEIYLISDLLQEGRALEGGGQSYEFTRIRAQFLNKELESSVTTLSIWGGVAYHQTVIEWRRIVLCYKVSVNSLSLFDAIWSQDLVMMTQLLWNNARVTDRGNRENWWLLQKWYVAKTEAKAVDLYLAKSCLISSLRSNEFVTLPGWEKIPRTKFLSQWILLRE